MKGASYNICAVWSYVGIIEYTQCIFIYVQEISTGTNMIALFILGCNFQ